MGKKIRLRENNLETFSNSEISLLLVDKSTIPHRMCTDQQYSIPRSVQVGCTDQQYTKNTVSRGVYKLGEQHHHQYYVCHECPQSADQILLLADAVQCTEYMIVLLSRSSQVRSPDRLTRPRSLTRFSLGPGRSEGLLYLVCNLILSLLPLRKCRDLFPLVYPQGSVSLPNASLWVWGWGPQVCKMNYNRRCIMAICTRCIKCTLDETK